MRSCLLRPFSFSFEERGWRRRWRWRRRRRRGWRQREQVGGQQQRIKFTGVVGFRLGLRRRLLEELSSAELSQESRELCHCANPAPLLPPPGGASALPHPPHSLILHRWRHRRRQRRRGPSLLSWKRKKKTPPHSRPAMTATRQQGPLTSGKQTKKVPSIPLVWWCLKHFCRQFPILPYRLNGFNAASVQWLCRLSVFMTVLVFWRHVASKSQRTQHGGSL